MALLGFICGLGAIAALAASAVGYRLAWWPVTTALSLAEYGAYAAALGVALSLVGLISASRRCVRRGVPLGLLGFVAAVPVLAMAVRWEYATRHYPPINDISTDTDDPPIFWDMPNPSEYPGGRAAELQHVAYPDLGTLLLSITRERAFTLAREIAQDNGWEIVAEAPDEGRIEAVATSPIYGFKDEVVIRIESAEGKAEVDLRSRSRLGRIDRGVNAARIRDFCAQLRERASEDRQP
ncbi:Protein of unknown function [Tistlia consotensis]|uniref:DUF1499 domain-containing protein n=2 Tax=Tistlia TaxID=1321364 RepID=A0A1Y6BXU1_9PROT|nr:Protein of unknown function [Tistlia consotensis USBA 355]SNR66886.1 Protein of unknown function [Tistlia consotensis]